MTMPINLILVRHGQSEGNVATRRSKAGEHGDYAGEFMQRHNSLWRLTDRGIWQAKTAGEWIRDNIGSTFGRYYTSEFLRAMETAHHLSLPEAQWFVDFNLRERDWGKFDHMSREERDARFSEELRNREIDSFYWRPPDGESIADLCLRVTRVLDTLHRECSNMDVVVVCHGEVMWAFRILLERLHQRQFNVLDASKHPHDRIHNCQVIHYTRENPITEKGSRPYLGWVRSICPSDLTLSPNEWVEINRRRYSNDELLAEAELTPRIIAE